MADEMTDFITFKAKGEDVKVPALSFYTVDLTRPLIEELDPELNWIDYAKKVLEIFMLGTFPDEDQPTRDAKKLDLMKKMSVPEMRDLTTSLNDLLRVSGFIMATAEPAAEAQVPETSLGVGTQMSLLPN